MACDPESVCNTELWEDPAVNTNTPGPTTPNLEELWQSVLLPDHYSSVSQEGNEMQNPKAKLPWIGPIA